MTNFRSILNLSILFKANKSPVLLCLKFQENVLCDEDLAEFSRTQSATDREFVYVDTGRLLFRGFDLGKRGGSGQTFIEFWFVQKNHLEDFVVGLNGRFMRLFLQLLTRLSIVNVISSIFVFRGVFFARK